jgi:protein transport protein SEC61 subunit gamma-like protein
MNFKSLISKFKSFVVECKRVFRVTKKPSNFEFKTIVKASGLGMIIIGLIGFMIQMIKQLFF